ncbi:hypothetical protein F5Y16DRAFT_406059 [Xylariaceae sp. FL0255]|nr:hypothetical protein F5Y16DRAFT_406059 [Xylariaceae sp. FL0255]
MDKSNSNAGHADHADHADHTGNGGRVDHAGNAAYSGRSGNSDSPSNAGHVSYAGDADYAGRASNSDFSGYAGYVTVAPCYAGRAGYSESAGNAYYAGNADNGINAPALTQRQHEQIDQVQLQQINQMQLLQQQQQQLDRISGQLNIIIRHIDGCHLEQQQAAASPADIYLAELMEDNPRPVGVSRHDSPSVPPASNRVKCEECNREFKTNRTLQDHLTYQHIGNTCQWPGCSYRVTQGRSQAEGEVAMAAHLEAHNAAERDRVAPQSGSQPD